MLFPGQYAGGLAVSTMTLKILDNQKSQTRDGVISFVGEDSSGSFGIQPGHARMMTVLIFGLARFCREGRSWEYIALPGAALYFRENVLYLVTSHYLVDTEYSRISKRLAEELRVEEEELKNVRQSLKNMEEALLKQIWEMRRQGVSLT